MILNKIREYYKYITTSPIDAFTLLIGIFCGLCIGVGFTTVYPVNILLIGSGLFFAYFTWYEHINTGKKHEK